MKPDNWLLMNNIPYSTSLSVCSTKIASPSTSKERHIWSAYEEYIFVKAWKELTNQGIQPTGGKILSLMKQDGITTLTRLQVTSHLQVSLKLKPS
jgi:hypothetical protein